jgi:hypothetical protein
MHWLAGQAISSTMAVLFRSIDVLGNDPPAEPEAFRLRAHQRGLVATEQKQTPSATRWEFSRRYAIAPGESVLPEMSNCYCLPGRARGPLLLG